MYENHCVDPYIDIIEGPKFMLGSCFEKFILKKLANKNIRYLRVLTQMNSHTSLLEVINAYGVVIPLPKEFKTLLPNFVKLMDPSTRWEGGGPVCREYDGANVFSEVYSNVSKFVQIVCWTCMHMDHDDDKFPFGFSSGLTEDLEKLFGKKRGLEVDGKTRGGYWRTIEDAGRVEQAPKPRFFVVGKEEPTFFLRGLLECILEIGSNDGNTSPGNSSPLWSNWDKMLASIPTTGGVMGAFMWSAAKQTLTLTKGNKESPAYGALTESLGYVLPLNEEQVSEAIESDQHSARKRDKTERKKQPKTAPKETQTVKQNREVQEQDDTSNFSDESDNDPTQSEVDLNPKLIPYAIVESIPEKKWPNHGYMGDPFRRDQLKEGMDLVYKGLIHISLSYGADEGLPGYFTRDSLKKKLRDGPPDILPIVLKEMLEGIEKRKTDIVSDLLQGINGEEDEEDTEEETTKHGRETGEETGNEIEDQKEKEKIMEDNSHDPDDVLISTLKRKEREEKSAKSDEVEGGMKDGSGNQSGKRNTRESKKVKKTTEPKSNTSTPSKQNQTQKKTDAKANRPQPPKKHHASKRTMGPSAK
jgi:hypothetical protein